MQGDVQLPDGSQGTASMKRSKANKSGDATAEPSAAAAAVAAATPSPSSPSSRLNTKRRRNNPEECCLTCKLRKVKCSGKSGNDSCDHCSRLKLSCSFARNADGTPLQDKVVRITPNGTVTEAGTLRKRAQRACSQCHLHKTKCSGDLPRCVRCQANDLQCEYVPAKRKFANLPGQREPTDATTPSQTSGTPQDSFPGQATESSTPSSLDVVLDPGPNVESHLFKREVLLKHVDAYFDQFYHMPCMGFLHPKTVYRLIEEDKLPQPLAAGICSITADYVSPNGEGRAFAIRCNEQVEYHVLRNLGIMERELLIYHVFAAIYNWMSGPLSKVWMWTATASRLIKCLQLNYEPDLRSSSVSYIDREIQRRCVWQIYIIDHFLSGGFEEHLLLPSSSVHIRLPCFDHMFKDEQPSAMETLDRSPLVPSNLGDYCLDACHVKLLTIRSQILNVTKRFADYALSSPADSMRPEQFMGHINQFQIALNRYKDSLPEHLKLSEANIDAHLLRPDRASYTMLQTWFCQTYIELYSFSLQKLKDPAMASSKTWETLLRSHQDFLHRSQQQAVAHAICLAQTWDYCLSNIKKHNSTSISKTIITVDWMIGACAVDVVQVLLIARKHCLYENLRDNTTAQMCSGRPIDDTLLADLVSFIVGLVEILTKFLPRVDCYRVQILDLVRRFDEEHANSNAIRVAKPDSYGSTANPSFPGLDNMLPGDRLEADSPPRGLMGTSTSITDRFLRNPTSLVDRRVNQGSRHANNHIIEPPVIPFCLEQARHSSPSGPFIIPTTGNHPPPPESHEQPAQLTGINSLGMGPAFDNSIKPTVLSDIPVTTPETFHDYPATNGHAIMQPQTPAMSVSSDGNPFGPYAAHYEYNSEHSQGRWVPGRPGDYHRSGGHRLFSNPHGVEEEDDVLLYRRACKSMTKAKPTTRPY